VTKKKLQLSSDGGAYGAVGEVCGRFCIGAFSRNLPSVVREDRCFHVQFSSKKFNKFCTFNAICKDNAAINCITVQHKKGIISVIFYW
jgi:hypothetical protein